MPVLLIILDGFGQGKVYPGNAISLAKTPTITFLKKNYPWTLLKASGEAVGVPKGTQGGSEVGHFTIGAGRVVFQSLETINRAIHDKSFFKKKALLEAYARVKQRNKTSLHLIGMISDQGVHSHINHLFALLELAKQKKVPRIFIHAITDGRDVPERSAGKFIKQIEQKISSLNFGRKAKIASIIGRYYAMDRDNNWDRTKKAYELYTQGKGLKEKIARQAIQHAYAKGITSDYYLEPILLDAKGLIKNGDAVIFWNFRTDRARQLTWAFTYEHGTASQIGITKYKLQTKFICLGPYSEKAQVVFPPPSVKNNLGEVISKAGLKQFRIAETEKYAHVTYFFNSQVEKPFPGEERLMIESKKCPSYAQKPAMSAREITKSLLPRLESRKYSLMVANFANCDLVGHSGNLQASVKAVEIIDECLGQIIPTAMKNNYVTIITGDHGNVEYKIYSNGEPCPSHTTNPVPCLIIGRRNRKLRIRKKGELQDVAPTILKIMGIEKPQEMTGKSLL